VNEIELKGANQNCGKQSDSPWRTAAAGRDLRWPEEIRAIRAAGGVRRPDLGRDPSDPGAG